MACQIVSRRVGRTHPVHYSQYEAVKSELCRLECFWRGGTVRREFHFKTWNGQLVILRRAPVLPVEFRFWPESRAIVNRRCYFRSPVFALNEPRLPAITHLPLSPADFTRKESRENGPAAGNGFSFVSPAEISLVAPLPVFSRSWPSVVSRFPMLKRIFL